MVEQTGLFGDGKSTNPGKGKLISNQQYLTLCHTLPVVEGLSQYIFFITEF